MELNIKPNFNEQINSSLINKVFLCKMDSFFMLKYQTN